jgi:hypothetical protein
MELENRMNKPDTGVSTFANRYKPTRRPKFAKELPPSHPKQNHFKFSLAHILID